MHQLYSRRALNYKLMRPSVYQQWIVLWRREIIFSKFKIEIRPKTRFIERQITRNIHKTLKENVIDFGNVAWNNGNFNLFGKQSLHFFEDKDWHFSLVVNKINSILQFAARFNTAPHFFLPRLRLVIPSNFVQ